ncbi:MAG: aminoglycoside phosphotransferase family protein [Myxococcota bacterium]
MVSAPDPHAVLPAWGVSSAATLTPVQGGLINKTFLVDEGPRRLVLQYVNPIFKPPVHLDIDAITAHLEATGMRTPRLVRTQQGELWATDTAGNVWRALTFLPGRVVQTAQSATVARAAGALVAHFHRAVSTLKHTFHFSRPGAHDTPEHLRRLERALKDFPTHSNYASVAPVGERILALAARLESLPEVPRRIIHGDLKISNLLFNDELTEGVALLDLDTLAQLTIPIELGDAFRSWCNPAGEDASEVTFSAELFEGAIRGYARAAEGLLTREEVDSLVLGTQTIALELAARFCADALNESYFGWNPQKFPSRSEHNRIRALSQLHVAESVAAQRAGLERVAQEAFSRHG